MSLRIVPLLASLACACSSPPEEREAPLDDRPFAPASEDAAPTDAASDGGAGGDDARPIDAAEVPPPMQKKIVAYFAAWSVYGRNFHVADVDAALITHLNYAFLDVKGGECVLGDRYADVERFYPGDSWDAGALRGSFRQLQLLKSKHPHLKTLLSIGGWTWSSGFSDAASTEAGRVKLAKSCAALMNAYGFDGLDVDWEYPGGGGLAPGKPEDTPNFTRLLAAFRAEIGDGKLLTIAAPAGPKAIANLELAKIHAYLDSINVMTYDFHGGWEKVTNHNAPLFASKGDPSEPGFHTDGAIAAYLAAGVPAAKIVVGAAFYGRGWAGVPSANDGLFQPATGPSPGTWEPGVLDWHDIAKSYLPTAKRFFSAEAKVPWLYDASRKIMISYDDPESHALRAKYVKERGLAGVMIWELSGDDRDRTLGKVLAKELL